MTDEEIMKRFIESTKELFDREKGKSISKKVNLGDTVPSKTETSVILQRPLIEEGMA